MSAPSSSSSGGGGATVFYYFFPPFAGSGALVGPLSAASLDPPTEPKNWVTSLPLRLLATVFKRLAETVTLAALRTLLNDYWFTSAPDPLNTKEA